MIGKSKEQMQIFVMIMIFMAIGYFLVITFFLKPQLIRSKELNSKNVELRKKIKKTKIAFNMKDKKEKRITNALKKIEDFEMLMPKGDESWSIEQLDQIAKRYDIIIKKIQPELSTNNKMYFMNNHKYDSRLIHVDVTCSYHKFGVFINTLERSSPFLKIKQINMTSGTAPDYDHRINFNIEYLVLKEFE